MYLIPRSSLVVTCRRAACRKRFCSKSSPQELPEEPTTCCMSGCANCVWIEYAEKLKKLMADSDSKRVAQIIVDKIKDPNMKAFLSVELKSKGF